MNNINLIIFFLKVLLFFLRMFLFFVSLLFSIKISGFICGRSTKNCVFTIVSVREEGPDCLTFIATLDELIVQLFIPFILGLYLYKKLRNLI